MIRNYSRTFYSGCLLAVLPLTGLLPITAHAQTALEVEGPAHTAYHNAVRLDVGGILARNFAYNALNNNPQLLLPLLLGYERQLAPRLSGNAEVLLNGGEPGERMSGVALQGRYYYFQGRKKGLNGFYVAPTVSYRAVRQLYYYGTSQQRRKLGGAGLLLGAQVPLSSRLLLDVSGGVMSWGRLNEKSAADATQGVYHYDNQTYYERNKAVFDGRLSLGYRF